MSLLHSSSFFGMKICMYVFEKRAKKSKKAKKYVIRYLFCCETSVISCVLSTFQFILVRVLNHCTVKLGDKEWFDKGAISRDQSPNLLQEDKEHFALRNNFRVTKKFLITKFDYNCKKVETAWSSLFSN